MASEPFLDGGERDQVAFAAARYSTGQTEVTDRWRRGEGGGGGQGATVEERGLLARSGLGGRERGRAEEGLGWVGKGRVGLGWVGGGLSVVLERLLCPSLPFLPSRLLRSPSASQSDRRPPYATGETERVGWGLLDRGGYVLQSGMHPGTLVTSASRGVWILARPLRQIS